MPQICCAVGCGHSSKNCKLKRFPADAERAAVWETNIQRAEWTRKPWHKLCQCHFDAGQWEPNRSDGLRKLTPYAVPCLFATHEIELGREGFSRQLLAPKSVLCKKLKDKPDICTSSDLKKELSLMRGENQALKSALSFFNSDQIQLLVTKNVPDWSNETIHRSLEMCLAVGTSGYKYLMDQGWPLPAPKVLERYWDEAGPLDNLT